jgi:hypothetical protein
LKSFSLERYFPPCRVPFGCCARLPTFDSECTQSANSSYLLRQRRLSFGSLFLIERDPNRARICDSGKALPFYLSISTKKNLSFPQVANSQPEAYHLEFTLYQRKFKEKTGRERVVLSSRASIPFILPVCNVGNHVWAKNSHTHMSQVPSHCLNCILSSDKARVNQGALFRGLIAPTCYGFFILSK